MTYDRWKTTNPEDALFDVPPEIEVECGACDGAGYIVKGMRVYEHGCGFVHMDSYEDPCGNCDGRGFFICEAEGDYVYRG